MLLAENCRKCRWTTSGSLSPDFTLSLTNYLIPINYSFIYPYQEKSKPERPIRKKKVPKTLCSLFVLSSSQGLLVKSHLIFRYKGTLIYVFIDLYVCDHSFLYSFWFLLLRRFSCSVSIHAVGKRNHCKRRRKADENFQFSESVRNENGIKVVWLCRAIQFYCKEISTFYVERWLKECLAVSIWSPRKTSTYDI